MRFRRIGSCRIEITSPTAARITGGMMNFHWTPASSKIEPLTAASKMVVPRLLFGAPQDEGTQRLGQDAPGILPRIARQPARHIEHLGLAQHARVEELEQAPQFAQMV